MRIFLLFSIFFFLELASRAEDFSVFEKDGLFGIKDGNGEVTVPAVYEKLGWTDGTSTVFAGVIGFKQNNLWGLISIKNKVLADNKFYTIAPFRDNLILASIKGKFSNHLFHGILDNQGTVIVSFNYFNLETLGEFFLATEFDQYHSKVGMLNQQNKIVIPIKYKTIARNDKWFIANRFDNKKDLYLNGRLISQNLDSVQRKRGMICYRNGLSGYFDSNGSQALGFSFKDVIHEGGGLKTIEFPKWEVYEDNAKILERNCDSLSLEGNFWTMYLNGVKHKVFPSDRFKVSNKYELQAVGGAHFVVTDLKSGKWSVIDEAEHAIVKDQDSIGVSGNHFIGKREGKWNLFNGFGSRVNRFPMQSIRQGVGQHFMTKRNSYWGVIDFSGKTYINFKYDSILVSTDCYIAKFHGKWGILDKHGNWKFYPEYEEVNSYGNLRVGRKGAAFTYFYGGRSLYKTTFRIVRQLDNLLVVENEESKRGLIDQTGSIIYSPQFDSLKRIGDYLIFHQSTSAQFTNLDGEVIVGKEAGYEDFGDLGEGYISAKRNGRWGFLDLKGRLRISNRYEDVKPFHEGFAAIKLRGRWGFIDKNEKLRVQPHYQQVSSFNNGLAIVKEEERFGLIDKTGEEVVSVDWPNIKRTNDGNYLIESDEDLKGLVNREGLFVLRPNYESIEDHSDEIIVKENGMMGVLDFQGVQKFKISYLEIKSVRNYLLLKR